MQLLLGDCVEYLPRAAIAESRIRGDVSYQPCIRNHLPAVVVGKEIPRILGVDNDHGCVVYQNYDVRIDCSPLTALLRFDWVSKSENNITLWVILNVAKVPQSGNNYFSLGVLFGIQFQCHAFTPQKSVALTLSTSL